jgi:superfamily II DNA or RNA helicase
MLYEEFITSINELEEQIYDYKLDNIEPDKIIKYLKHSHKLIPDEIKHMLICNNKSVNSSIKLIKSRTELYTNTYSFDKIINRLKTREITKTDNMDIIFHNLLDFMISNDIINELYSSYYVPPLSISGPYDKIIEVFTPRCNQVDAFKYLEDNGLNTSIHCQATGCGKTYIILRYIDYAFKKYGNKTKVILFTERVNILKDLFDFSKNDHTENKEKINRWKNLGIADITPFNIINRVTIKKKDWMEKINNSEGASLLVINRAFLTLNKKNYHMLKNIKLILHDECHNTSSEKCNEFLKHAKILKVPIIGFSATPLRTGKFDKDKLLEIYGNNINDRLVLNLATNYNMIYAIEKELIVPPEFYWYHINSKYLNDIKNNIERKEYEYDTVSTILDGIIKNLPSKKIVAWCGMIESAKEWKELFIKNHKRKANLSGFKFYLDTSKTSDDEYEEFKKSQGNCILFCANKHREGSDIMRLDACLFLDGVINRGCIPFIQSIGRVLRVDTFNPDKKNGVIIDGIYKTENYEREFVDKIIGYYMALQNISGDIEENMTKYDKYIELRDIIKFDKENEVISLNFKNNKININMNKLHWESVASNFEGILQNKIKLTAGDNMMDKGKILVEKFGFNIRTDFYNEYKNISNEDKEMYNLPDIDSEDYNKLFNGKSWFTILGLEHDYYTSPFEAKNSLMKKTIIEKPEINWTKWCDMDNKLPPYPNYVWDGFYMDVFKNTSRKLK